MEATTKDLRLHTAEVLAAADRGEEVIITYRGKRRALLTRWPATGRVPQAGGRNPAFGLWREQTVDVEEQVRQLRRGRKLP